MKVALYARVSTHDKDQNPENQLIKLRDFVQRHSWDIFETYIDYASGAKTSRPAFDRMIKDGRARRFDAILVVRIDRLARSSRRLLNILEEMRGHGVELICSGSGNRSESPSRKATFYRSRGSLRTRIGPYQGEDQGWSSKG